MNNRFDKGDVMIGVLVLLGFVALLAACLVSKYMELHGD